MNKRELKNFRSNNELNQWIILNMYLIMFVDRNINSDMKNSEISSGVNQFITRLAVYKESMAVYRKQHNILITSLLDHYKA